MRICQTTRRNDLENSSFNVFRGPNPGLPKYESLQGDIWYSACFNLILTLDFSFKKRRWEGGQICGLARPTCARATHIVEGNVSEQLCACLAEGTKRKVVAS